MFFSKKIKKNINRHYDFGQICDILCPKGKQRKDTMSHNNTLFSLIGALCIGGLVTSADAAPTVKKLGVSAGHMNGTATSATPKAATNAKTSSGVRVSSTRLGGSGIKPVSVNKIKSVTDTAAKVEAANAVDANRLSIGKYIHASGASNGYIKSSGATAAAASSDVVALTDRVSDLETKMEGKQDTLTSGNGVEIVDGTISVSETITALPTTVQTITQQLNDNYATKTDVQNIVNQSTVNSDKIKNTDTGVYENVEFDDSFTEEGFNWKI